MIWAIVHPLGSLGRARRKPDAKAQFAQVAKQWRHRAQQIEHLESELATFLIVIFWNLEISIAVSELGRRETSAIAHAVWRGYCRVSWVDPMPEWMATRILALLLGLSGGFAVHYTLFDPGSDPLTDDESLYRPPLAIGESQKSKAGG